MVSSIIFQKSSALGHRAPLPNLFPVFSLALFSVALNFLVLRGFVSGFAVNSRLTNLVCPPSK